MDTARTAVLLATIYQNPFSTRSDSRDPVAYAEKTTLPRVRAGVSSSVHVAMLRTRLSNGYATGYRNKNLFPFRPWPRFPSNRKVSESPRHCTMLPLSLRIDWLVSNGCSHETLLHIGPPGPPWIICYYHQDLHCRRLQPVSLPKFSAPPTRPSYSLGRRDKQSVVSSGPTVWYKWEALAPSIFRAGCFGRWVVTHSLADSDFHGHRPAVISNQHLLWDLMSFHLGTLTRRSVHPAAPVLLTKNGPLGTPIRCPRPIERHGLLTHLKFENKLRTFRPQGF